MPDKNLWAKNSGDSPLNHLPVIVTQKCNLKCSYCLRDANSDKKHNPEIPFEKLKSIILSAHRSGCRSTGLTGGEFYLYSKWRELLSLIGKLRWNCLIETNGIAISQNQELLEYTKREIGKHLSMLVSLDSYDKKKHDLHRGKGSFEKAIKAIKLIASQEICLEVNAVITPGNLLTFDEVQKYVQFSRDLGANFINFGRVVAEARGNNIDLVLSQAQEKQIVSVLNEYLKRSGDKKIRRGFFRNSGHLSECNRIGREICVSPFGLHPCIFHQEIKIGELDDFNRLLWGEFIPSLNLLQKGSRVGHKRDAFTCFDCALSLPKYIKELKKTEIISI